MAHGIHRMAGPLPRWFAWSVLVLCLLPLPLFVLGLDLEPTAPSLEQAVAAPGSLSDNVHRALAGSFTHVLLEWTAFCAALASAILALLYYRITRDATAPILGMTLFCAGTMDAFHALAAVRLIEGSAEPARLIPFTWALCRTFAAAILIGGVSAVLFSRRAIRQEPRFLVAVCITLAVLAWVTIVVCAAAPTLPRTMFAESIVARPFDLVPLVLFLGAGPLFYLYHRRHPGRFSQALLISMAAEVVIEVYMAFGSRALYDGWFNVAHGLKIVAYGVPMVGLLLDYDHKFASRARLAEALQRSEERFYVAVRGTNDGLWDWDPETDRVWYAPRFRELLGYRPTDEFREHIDTFQEHLHPDDRARVWEAVRAHIEHDDIYDVEYRLRTRQGAYRWFRARGQAVRGPDGRATRMAGSIQDITAQRMAEELLRQVNEDLQRANQELEQFVYSASHDLKSPLVTIQGFLGHLRADLREGRTERLDHFAERVEGATHRMRRNIDDLLELSRIGRVVENPTCVDTAELLRQRADEHSMTIEELGVTVRIDPNMPAIVADEARVQQVFDNLFVNALKYGCTADTPVIECGATTSDGEIRYYVRDNGVGVDEPYRERVFELFCRLDRGPRNGPINGSDGTGIGLAIVRRIAELHGGRAWVEAGAADGTGACFWVAFPARMQAEAGVAPTDEPPPELFIGP